MMRWHKWAALAVGLQMLIWIGTGIYFNLVDHQRIGGHQYHQRAPEPAWSLDQLVDPTPLLEQYAPVVRLTLVDRAGHPYYQLEHQRQLYARQTQTLTLIDAVSGDVVAINPDLASAIARASYGGPGAISEVTALPPRSAELPKEENPVWRVAFADDLETVAFVDASSGRLVAHQNRHSREAALMLKLHFMDYTNQGGFNHPLMWLFALLSLALSLSGLTLLLRRLGSNLRHWHARRVVLHTPGGAHQLRLAPRQSVLEGMQREGLAVRSECGGGGSCGRCRIRLEPGSPISAAEQRFLSPRHLEQGWRLACQQFGQ
ncbi:2Fe-2S iron-sulfur cluster-binding protein [Ferrimonas balearica]|uniref:2Fe-2S iron-sulfur cluster-binding protein n=2 Tax=Ferrimonas balearica TaxID=44012 RepID=UPI001C99C83E|nr:2Fe-2S iron-sulfur cluster-binding protein [Ferrimonas balearica]MBY5923373.1 2Fe-2S iron-sulfur cluster binding domain-containing protein [Ferrimonas balearica]MBY5995331.1 2Fe-2S iron-sulfur cluster binding domain-containing protein [Ferrimonas balearica]